MTKKGKKLAQKVNLGSKCKQRKEGVGWEGGRKNGGGNLVGEAK